MAVTAAPSDFRVETRLPSDYLPLLRWMIFTGVCVFGFVLAWHFGLIRMMLNSDKTYISVIILLLYAAASIHCLVRTVIISRELSKAMRIQALVRGGTHEFKVVGEDVVTGEGTTLPRGEVTTHIRNLIMKAKLQGDEHRLDQTLLLRGLADALRGPNQLGGYASDSLMKLGLLGTIIGFILMLGADRRPRRRGPRLGQELDGPDERRHGSCHVHDADRPDRLDPGADPVLHARQGDRPAVRHCHQPDGGVRGVRPRARAEWKRSVTIHSRSRSILSA